MEKFKRIFNLTKPKKETRDFDFNLVTNFKEETFSIVWRIENLHHCTLKFREYLESTTFSTKSCSEGSEVKWILRFFPRGKKISSTNCDKHKFRSEKCEMAGLSIYRILKSSQFSSKKPSVKCRLSYKRDSLNNSGYCFTEQDVKDIKMDELVKSYEYGASNLFCADSLDPETSQILIVKCDIINVIVVHNGESPGNHMSGVFKSDSLIRDLKVLYESKEFSDITLQAKEIEFPTHKAILASRSEVFAAMIRHNTKGNKVVHLKDEPEVLSCLLQYFYTGTLNDFNIEKAISLYPVADKYLVEEVKGWCTDFILANMKVGNACQIAVLADLHSDKKLKEAALSMFRNHRNEIFKRKEWQELLCDTNRCVLVSDILKAVSADFTTDAAN